MSSFLNCSSEMEYFLWMASRLSLDQYSSSRGFSCSVSFIQSSSRTASNILSIFSQNFWQTVLLPTLSSIFLSISLMRRMMRSLYSPLSLNLKAMAELKRQSLRGWSVLSISLMELLTFLLTSCDCVMGYLAIQYSSSFYCSCTLIIQKCLGVRWCRSESRTMLRRIYWLLYILQYQQLSWSVEQQWKARDHTFLHSLDRKRYSCYWVSSPVGSGRLMMRSLGQSSARSSGEGSLRSLWFLLKLKNCLKMLSISVKPSQFLKSLRLFRSQQSSDSSFLKLGQKSLTMEDSVLRVCI